METTTVDKLEAILKGMLKRETDEAKRIRLMEMMDKPVLTNSDFLKLFCISARSSYRWRKEQGIPYLRISGRIYYLWTALLPVLESKQYRL
ncbi:hypothetical protein SAMN06265348_12138 [Pedobacter westerhofensis]|uniref:Helix-turn-helix domain-containing protein n=1 Tax=Pedobacter westerhofensis TaxID=425512 RepID=A0A521FUM3_9SPHI|nr:hypothetical protein [Pedobacter westerhofensis]SMO99270.1 hypothetical protein SAMN06265348_12138 [Pedobacter westerhofensis]